jgi:hypothetical protein
LGALLAALGAAAMGAPQSAVTPQQPVTVAPQGPQQAGAQQGSVLSPAVQQALAEISGGKRPQAWQTGKPWPWWVAAGKRRESYQSKIARRTR